MLLLVELVFDMYVTSMELQSFEKLYVTLLNSAIRVYKQPLYFEAVPHVPMFLKRFLLFSAFFCTQHWTVGF